jgi:hypothetical protein
MHAGGGKQVDGSSARCEVVAIGYNEVSAKEAIANAGAILSIYTFMPTNLQTVFKCGRFTGALQTSKVMMSETKQQQTKQRMVINKVVNLCSR